MTLHPATRSRPRDLLHSLAHTRHPGGSLTWRASRWPVYICVIALSLVLAACNPAELAPDVAWPAWLPFTPQQDPGDDTTLSALTPPPDPNAPHAGDATLLFLTWPLPQTETEFLQAQIASFVREFPGAPIDLVQAADYERRLLAPTINEQGVERPADIFLATGFALPSLIAANLLAPLPTEYDRLDQVAPALAPGFGVGRRAFCAPRDAHTLAVAYNPALFDRGEIPYPDPAWDWEDFAAAAEAVTDQDFFIFGLTLNADFTRMAPFMLQAGGDWIDPATGLPMLDAATSQRGMEFYIARFADGHAVYDTTLDGVWPGEAFGRGSAGMTIEGSWLLPFLEAEFPRLEYDTVAMPQGPAGAATLAFTTCLGVSPNSPARERALNFAAYLTRPDVAQAWRAHHGGMPVTPAEIAAWQTVDPRRAAFAEGVQHARVWQLPLGWETLPNTYTSLIRGAINDEISVEELAGRMQRAAASAGALPGTAESEP